MTDDEVVEEIQGMGHTCALDVADGGEIVDMRTLADYAGLSLNKTWRTLQKAIEKLSQHRGKLEELYRSQQGDAQYDSGTPGYGRSLGRGEGDEAHALTLYSIGIPPSPEPDEGD